MTDEVPRRQNSNDVVVNFPDSGCPVDGGRDKHVHAQAEWGACHTASDLPVSGSGHIPGEQP